jgi:hypothetical protein
VTADLTASAERALTAARPRADLLAELAAAKPFPGRYRVVRQFTHLNTELVVCSHRFDVVAEWCAWRWAKRHAGETGGHYTARRRAGS